MNVEAIRHFYNYHFAENRKIWDRYILPLSQEQFTRPTHYSVGSVRNQVVHLMDVDSAWFGDLRRDRDLPELADDESDKEVLRAHWDGVERRMREYLANLTDDKLTDKPLEGEDKDLLLWQVLLHVVNHGTDHRAQLLRLLNDLGVETRYQDYIFYTYDNP
jgi:uncharacterized damage-inducible protein DinB